MAGEEPPGKAQGATYNVSNEEEGRYARVTVSEEYQNVSASGVNDSSRARQGKDAEVNAEEAENPVRTMCGGSVLEGKLNWTEEMVRVCVDKEKTMKTGVVAGATEPSKVTVC